MNEEFNKGYISGLRAARDALNKIDADRRSLDVVRDLMLPLDWYVESVHYEKDVVKLSSKCKTYKIVQEGIEFKTFRVFSSSKSISSKTLSDAIKVAENMRIEDRISRANWEY